MSGERRLRIARKLAYQRLKQTCENDSLNCEDEALTWGEPDADPDCVRQALRTLAREFEKRLKSPGATP